MSCLDSMYKIMYKIKKLSALLLAFLFCVTLIPISAHAAQLTVPLTAVNVSRGENHLIVYKPSFGTSTATNRYGCEISVDKNNKITKVSTTGNMAIPEDGFVLSGHGTMRDWILANCAVGKYCYYDTRSMKVLISDTPTEFGGMFYTVSTTYTKVNGVRNENNLVIYTNSGHTFTNEWGSEAVVGADGRIVSVGDNNNAVPSGGFVISGHGTASEWVLANAKVGMKASYSTSSKTLTLEMDAQAYLIAIDSGITQLKEKLDEGKAAFKYYDYDYISDCLEQMKALREDYTALTADKEREKCLEQIEAIMYLGLTACTESYTVEYRGVWIRPTQKTQKDVSDYVQKLKDSGINTICLETLYNSTLICPAPEGSYFEQNPAFNGFDVLGAYVEECHKRDMELHIWMPVFYSSHTNCYNHKRSVWYKKPEWRLINDSGEDTAVKGNSDFCFLNPAHPEVQEFLTETYKYLVTEYDVDGFELDYIRYPDVAEDDHGYDEITINGYKQAYNTSITPTYNKNAGFWNNWVQYRCDIITGFVKNIRDMFDKYAPQVLLCADVGPNSASARTTLYQDYATWLENGWIDLLKPMSYSLGAVKETYKNLENADGKLVASGIGVFSEAYNGYDCATHTMIAVEQGANGVMFFEASAYLAKETYEYLGGAGAFRNSAITPTLDPQKALYTAVDYAISRVNDIIVPLNGMSKADADRIISKLRELRTAVDTERNATLESKAKAIISSLGNTAAEKAVKGDLNKFINITQNIHKERNASLNDIILGDVNQNGSIDTFDYILTRASILGITRLDDEQLVAADVNKDGNVNSFDYVLLRAHILGLTVIK